MEVAITRSVEALLLPPGGFLLLFAVSLLLWWKRRAAAWFLLWISLIGLYGLSLPITAQSLMRYLETSPSLDANTLQAGRAQAIVILAAGRYAGAPEYQGDTVSSFALERLRYGARLHRLTGLPVIVSGGDPFETGHTPEAMQMQQALVEDFKVNPVWVEGQSRTTGENVRYTKILLDQHNISEIYLVTHAWHMPRALQSFARVGVKAIPAPMGFYSQAASEIPALLRWLPSANALNISTLALHEMMGMVWYRVRY
jgi:uncharacterized SAM-binding protein YcdF (DUF218 family)